jgi:hypothetical protein
MPSRQEDRLCSRVLTTISIVKGKPFKVRGNPAIQSTLFRTALQLVAGFLTLKMAQSGGVNRSETSTFQWSLFEGDLHYPCRRFPLNSYKPLHGGDTGSIPVPDAKGTLA